MRLNIKKIEIEKYQIKCNMKIVISCMILVFFMIGIQYILQQIKGYSGQLDIVLNEPLSEQEACTMQEKSRQMEQGYEFTLWSQKMEQVICTPSLENKSLEVTAVALCGKSNILLENALEFDYQEKNICLVDKKAAYEMYGTTEVKGLILSYQGMQYEIADVINMEEGIFVYQISGKGKVQLNRISIKNSSGKSLAYLKEVFDNQWIRGKRIDYEWITFLMHAIVWIVFFILIFVIGRQLKNEIFIGNKKRNICAIFCDTLVEIMSIVVWISSIFVPKDYLIDLSNKQFWLEFIEEKRESLRFFFMVEKSVFDMEFFFIIWAIIGVIGLLIIINIVYSENTDRRE